jgi:hypothetical protein
MQVEELLAKLAGLLPAEIYQLVEKSLRTLQWVMGLIEAKETSLGRLQRIIFGAKTEKTRQLFPAPAATSQTAALTTALTPKRKGHGRTAAAGYTGAKQVRVASATPSGRSLSGLQNGQTLPAKTTRTTGAHYRPTFVRGDPLPTGEVALQPLRHCLHRPRSTGSRAGKV